MTNDCVGYIYKHRLIMHEILSFPIIFCLQIMDYKIYTHEIRSNYAAKVENFRSYDTISKDIIQRWTYPLVPDIQSFGSSVMKLGRQGMYSASGEDEKQLITSGKFTLKLKDTLLWLSNFF